MLQVGMLVAAGAALLWWQRSAPPPGPPPNIILILLDAARADYFGGCAPTADSVTPYIDGLARTGRCYPRHYSHANFTRSSMSHLFLSRLDTFPVLRYFEDRDYSWWLRDEDIARNALPLPKALAAAGYRTVAVSAHPYVNTESPAGQWFDTIVDVKPTVSTAYAYAGDVFTDARKAAEAHAAEHPNQPLFLYVHIMDTHLPHDPAPPYDRYFTGDWAGRTRQERAKKEWELIARRYGPFDDADRRFFRESTRGSYAYVDDSLRAFHEGVAAILDNPVVAITADHGDALGENNMVGHHFGAFGMEPLHHIPLVVAGGDLQPHVEQGFSGTVDVMPTLLELARVMLPAGIRIHGRSLAPRAKGGPAAGTFLVARDRWRDSQIGYRTDGATYLVTSNRAVFLQPEGSSEPRGLGQADNPSVALPPPLRDFIAQYREIDRERTFTARGRNVRVTPREFDFPSHPGEPGMRCWERPALRDAGDLVPFQSGMRACAELVVAFALPRGTYLFDWMVTAGSDPAPGPPDEPVLEITLGSRNRKFIATRRMVSEGKLPVGAVAVGSDPVRMAVRPLAPVSLVFGVLEGQGLDRTVTGQIDAPKLDPSTLEQLRSLGYIR